MLATSCSGGDDPPKAAPSSSSATTSRTESSGTSQLSTTTISTAGTSTTSTTRLTPTTSTKPGEAGTPSEQKVIASYIAYWDARFAANTGTPDPTDPVLAKYAIGAQLAAVKAETKKNLDQGLAFRARGHPANFRRVRVVSLKGDRAVVQECFVDDGLVVRRKSGKVVNDTIATHNVRGELTRVSGTWRVARTQLVQRWEGVAGCARVS